MINWTSKWLSVVEKARLQHLLPHQGVSLPPSGTARKHTLTRSLQHHPWPFIGLYHSWTGPYCHFNCNKEWAWKAWIKHFCISSSSSNSPVEVRAWNGCPCSSVLLRRHGVRTRSPLQETWQFVWAWDSFNSTARSLRTVAESPNQVTWVICCIVSWEEKLIVYQRCLPSLNLISDNVVKGRIYPKHVLRDRGVMTWIGYQMHKGGKSGYVKIGYPKQKLITFAASVNVVLTA